MRYLTSFLVWALIASGELTATRQVKAPHIDNPQPADIRIDHEVLAENQLLLYTFLDTLRGTGLHAGFVEIAGCSDLPKGRLQIKQGVTVRQAMDAIVVANPGYRWELEDGVVNLMPLSNAPLLDTRIAKFQMAATDREIPALLQDLLRLPEVRRHEAALGLKQGFGQGGPSAGEVNPVSRQPVPIEIDVQNLPLRDAFNKIVQGSPKGVWIYHETDCRGAKTFTVEVASDY